MCQIREPYNTNLSMNVRHFSQLAQKCGSHGTEKTFFCSVVVINKYFFKYSKSALSFCVVDAV